MWVRRAVDEPGALGGRAQVARLIGVGVRTVGDWLFSGVTPPASALAMIYV